MSRFFDPDFSRKLKIISIYDDYIKSMKLSPSGSRDDHLYILLEAFISIEKSLAPPGPEDPTGPEAPPSASEQLRQELGRDMATDLYTSVRHMLDDKKAIDSLADKFIAEREDDTRVPFDQDEDWGVHQPDDEELRMQMMDDLLSVKLRHMPVEKVSVLDEYVDIKLYGDETDPCGSFTLAGAVPAGVTRDVMILHNHVSDDPLMLQRGYVPRIQKKYSEKYQMMECLLKYPKHIITSIIPVPLSKCLRSDDEVTIAVSILESDSYSLTSVIPSDLFDVPSGMELKWKHVSIKTHDRDDICNIPYYMYVGDAAVPVNAFTKLKDGEREELLKKLYENAQDRVKKIQSARPSLSHSELEKLINKTADEMLAEWISTADGRALTCSV